MVEEKIYTSTEIQDRLQLEMPMWQFSEGHITREYRVNGWKSVMVLANTIGHLAEIAWHHPDLHLSYGKISVRLMTHTAGGITDKDFELAKKIEDTVNWLPGEDAGSALSGTPEDERYQYIKK